MIECPRHQHLTHNRMLLTFVKGGLFYEDGIAKFERANCCTPITGSLSLWNLPPKLRLIEMSDNGFTGEFRLVNVPDSLMHIVAMNNTFSGKAVIPKRLRDAVILYHQRYDMYRLICQSASMCTR